MAGDDLDAAWEIVVNKITPCQPENSNIEGKEHFQNALAALHEAGLTEILEDWFFSHLKSDLQEKISSQFWEYFNNADVQTAHSCIPEAFSQLHESLSAYVPCVDKLECARQLLPESQHGVKSVAGHVHMLVKSLVFFKTTKVFQEAMLQFYTRAFQVYCCMSKDEDLDLDHDDDEEDESMVQCLGCMMDKEDCQCQEIMDTFHTLNQQLDSLHLLDWLSGDSITTIIHQKIQHHIDHTCQGNFEVHYLQKLDKWLEDKVVGWLKLLYSTCSDDVTSAEMMERIQSYKGRLYHVMYEIYALVRIEELFNIIVEFPESEPALLDLKTCLEKTDLRPKLVQSLRHALETRLLHPGVNTSDILTAYISAIRALRMLDPTGVLLELVCDPVRKYLRCREDTVRCIVSSLTDDGNNELSDELIKAQPLKMDDSVHSDDGAEDWEQWTPDPVDADPAKTSPSRRSSDIISMLVNIYGSKELFVNEYRMLLADRILSQFSYATEKEIRYLELLKLRFGETQLHYCEVMLKDVADSKRINGHIIEQRKKQEPQPEEIPVSGMILSAQFWPTFREEKLELPPVFQTALESYTKAFEALKGNRTLNWKPHLGLVNIEIELKEKTLTFDVSPVHATIIMHFQDQARWTVEELSAVMHMPTAAIRRKITFWQSQGLLREEATDTFVLMEEQKGKGQEVILMEEDDTESAMASQQDQREEELQVFWTYIVGMLTNLESLPLDRIHSILKMFAVQGTSTGEISLQELQAFLDRKVRDQKLIYSGGVYRLPKAGT